MGMAKGQKRSNREHKKPKAEKKKTAAASDTVLKAFAKQKPAQATTSAARK
jgi:hypothetical protein